MASPELPYFTCRLQRLPLDLDTEGLRETIPLEHGERVLFSSLSIDHYAMDESVKTATITWNVIPQYIRQLNLKDHDTLKLRSSNPFPQQSQPESIARLANATIDKHLTGLTPLNATSIEEAEDRVLIIAVTGVGGRAFVSWQHECGAMWLRDYLPRDVQKASVFTYGYPSKLLQSASHARLADYTQQFLAELQGLASRMRAKPRPIILIGHSFGGLIIKDAIIKAAAEREEYGKLLLSVYSVFFMGVPHRGLNVNALKEMVTKEPTKDLITELEEGSTSIDSLSEKFPGTIHTLKIVSCWELKETPTQQKTDGRWKRTGPPVIMVNKMSACLFLPNEVRVPIQANHSMMAKLSDEAGSEYHTLKNYLISHVQLAPEAIRRRLVKQECAYVLSEVYPLAAFVYETVCLVKGTPIDTAKYQRILRNELSFLEAFGSMLVDDDMVWMFENSNMSAEWPEYMALCLQRLRTTLSSYTRLAMQYYEPYRNALRPNNFYTSTVLSPRLLIDTTETRPDNKLLVDPQLNSRLFEEDSLDLILDQCRLSTKGLREAMAFAASCSLRFDTRKQSESFQARENVHELQLGSILRRQYLMQTFDDHEAQPLQGHLEDVKERPIDADVLLMDFYAVQGMSPETVIVEYHCYDPSPRFEFNSHNAVSQESIRRQRVDKIRSRMRKLARMLQTASSVPQGLSKATENPALSSLDCLCCIGFLEELESSRFALLFKASPRITVQIGALRSLTFFINQNLASPKGQLTAALDLKFTLALRLCNAVLDVHVCGWVHKSIRSTNVLLVPPPPHSELDVTGQGPNVVLKGFEVSRPVQAASSARANFDPDTNLYRHPARQDAPTDRFRKEHDIYALGVVLLEIGLWETIPSLFRRAIDKARDTGGGFPEPDRVRDKLVTLAHDGLPPRMGTKYAEAVRKCLTGDFGISVDDEQQTTLALELRRQVVDVVEIGSRL